MSLYYNITNRITANILSTKTVAADTNTRTMQFVDELVDNTTYDMVASKAVTGTGTVTVDAGAIATPYGIKGFLGVYGILISVTSGTLQVKQAATTNPLGGCPVFATDTTLGPGFYFFKHKNGVLVTETSRNIEVIGTAVNATVLLFGIEGSVQP
jgi:hypothetical protein